MRKSIFLWALVLTLIVAPINCAFAKKAQKHNPIKDPVIINTKPVEEIQSEPEAEEPAVVDDAEVKEPVDVKEIINNIEPEESTDVVEADEVKPTEKKDEVPVVEIRMRTAPKLIVENPSNEQIEEFFVNFSNLQNKHNLNGLKKVYADDFINTDGQNKTQLFALMERTYKGYPDMKTEYQIKHITSTKKYAMATVIQKITATTKDNSKITKDKGTYNATLETVFYLKRMGSEWKIYSEEVQSEISTLAYGMAKDVQGLIDAPQKVLSGNDYSASVIVDTPDGYSAIASINSTQIVEGYNMTGESFRQVPADGGAVERVLKANTDNNNEAVVVSVGFTKLTQDMFKKAKMDISGLMILMRRVDIVPENSNHKVTDKAKNDKK